MEEIKLYEYNYDKPELDETFLAHHGVLGQKWGEQHGPPYPLDDSVSTGNRLKKGGGSIIGSDKPKSRHQLRVEARKKKKLNKKRVETLKKARELKTQKDAKKKEILASNDIKKIYENRDLFSKGEIDKFVEKYNSDQSLRRLVDQEKSAKNQKILQKVQNIQKYADTGAKLATNLVSFYDTYNSVVNRIDQQEKAQDRQRVQDFKKKIVDTRDLQKAYDNRSMFNNKELENLMATVDTDAKLKKKIEEVNKQKAAEAKVKAEAKASQQQSQQSSKINGKMDKQVKKFNKEDAKLQKEVNKKSTFRNREEFEEWKSIVDRKVNQDYYFGDHDNKPEYKVITDDQVKEAKRAFELSQAKAKRAAEEKNKKSKGFFKRKN